MSQISGHCETVLFNFSSIYLHLLIINWPPALHVGAPQNRLSYETRQGVVTTRCAQMKTCLIRAQGVAAASVHLARRFGRCPMIRSPSARVAPTQ